MKKRDVAVKVICICLAGGVSAGCVSGPAMGDNAEERVDDSGKNAGSIQTAAPGQNGGPIEEPADTAVPDGSSYEARGRILTWKDGREAACSLTFDDGSTDQFLLAAPVLETYKVGGSFFLKPGARDEGARDEGPWNDRPQDEGDQESIQVEPNELEGGPPPSGGADLHLPFSWNDAAALLKRDHEIGSRGKEPAGPADAGDGIEAVGRELLDSAREIRRRLPSDFLPPVGGLTFSWPAIEIDPAFRTVAEESYLAARGGPGLSSSPFIRESFTVPSVRAGGTDSFPAWVRKLEMNSQRRGWIVFAFHEFARELRRVSESDRQPVAIGKLETLLRYLADHSYWTAPFGRVYRYAIERHNSRLIFEEIRDDGIVLSLDDGLDDTLYSEALTVEVLPPADMEVEAIRSENGALVPFFAVSKGWIRFEAFPDGSSLFLSAGK